MISWKCALNRCKYDMVRVRESPSTFFAANQREGQAMKRFIFHQSSSPSSSRNPPGNTHSWGASKEEQMLGVQKLTRSGLNGVSGRDFWKTNLPFSRLIKILHLRGEKCLQNAHFGKQKGPCLKTPLNWTGSVFPLLKMCWREGWRKQVLQRSWLFATNPSAGP